jgi:uncharacterized iron-regulated protein
MTVHRLPFLLIALWALSINLKAQTLRAYQLYDSAGQAVEFEQLVAKAAEVDVFLFGELHNNPICHWLQIEITKALYAQDSSLILGAEMLERDNQEALNLYLADSIDQKGLDTLARLWPNYQTDYKMLVDFAKDSGLTFIATNIPRRYARMVYKQGMESLDSLSERELTFVAPLPMPFDGSLPGYQAMLEMMGGHGGENLVKAQAIKDATMAYSIAQSLQPGQMLLHFNGDYHSKDFEGICWYLNQYAPNLRVLTLSTVLKSQVEKPTAEEAAKADFILVVDEDVTTSY